MNRGFNQLSELRRQIELGQIFHETNRPGETPEGEGDPENSDASTINFNGAVGYVTSRQQLRTILLVRNEKKIHDEAAIEQAHCRKIERELLAGHIVPFGECLSFPDPALD